MSADTPNEESMTYGEAKELARHEDPEVRRQLALRDDIQPEILYYLAEDSDAGVRQTVAQNLAAPRQTDILLAKDSDASVRGDLASKIARVAPGLNAEEQDKAQQVTYEALELLARDQITKVREILSDALKDVTDAPADVIKTLALDAEIAVSGPVLEFSPVLTDDDLLEIIETGTARGGLNAISKRHGVVEIVSDAIVGTDDVSAIADLLANDSAQIRESTLDELIENAPDVGLWHAPLAGRPKLPDGAAMRLAGFLADNLLGVLQERADLDEDALKAVKALVKKRLGEGVRVADHDQSGQDFLNMEPPLDMVERLFDSRKLDGGVISKALNAGDHSFVLAAIIVRSGIDAIIVKRIFVEKSAKGITALAWKAGMPARMAAQLQQRMGRLSPSDVLESAEDDFPLKEEDLNFQLEFFADLCSKGS